MNIVGNEINDEVIFELGKFVVLWNIFEREYCDNFANERRINQDAESLIIDRSKLNNLAQVLNIRRDFYEQTIIDYVNYSLHPVNAKDSNEDYKKLMRDFLNLDGDKLNTGCLLTILRIRNNLMHGLKTIEYINDQIELYKSINGVLESLDRKR